MTAIGLVLGGGGATGFAFHAATLDALRDATGWDPRTAEVIVGTSAGANMAALLRGGVPTQEVLERLLSVPTNPDAMARLRAVSGDPTILPFAIPTPSAPRLIAREMFAKPHRARVDRLALGLLPSGRFSTEIIGEHPAALHGDRWPAAATWLMAVSLDTGERVAFGREGAPEASMADAVRASSAIPSFFKPVVIGDQRYVDGGWHSNTNADMVVDENLDLVVVVSPMTAAPRIAVRNVLAGLRLYSLMRLRRELSVLESKGVEVLVIEPDAEIVRSMGINPMDTSKMLQIVVHTSARMIRRFESYPHDALETLRHAAEAKPAPVDVPMPD